jgi:hypothetical protein
MAHSSAKHFFEESTCVRIQPGWQPFSIESLLYFLPEVSMNAQLQIWDLWYPQAGATGTPFAGGRLDETNVLLVHAPPPTLTVEVRSEDGKRIAYAQDLAHTADRPIARLTLDGEHITREDLWPTQNNIGQLVILPGGEVGKLISWWNADDGSEWRWQVEFYNHR